jgi:hypothetical protein
LSFDKHLIIKLGGVRNSAAASQPCSSGHITTDKRIRRAITKFFSCSTEVGGVLRTTIETVKANTYIHLQSFGYECD